MYLLILLRHVEFLLLLVSFVLTLLRVFLHNCDSVTFIVLIMRLKIA